MDAAPASPGRDPVTPADRPVVLVTGASGGIGEELARQAAADGHDVVLVARSLERLDRLADELRAAGTTAEVLVADLETAEGVAAVASRVQESAGRTVDVLVNNAGFGAVGTFATLPVESLVGEIEVNVVALVRLTRAALPGMLARGRGGILNVASLASFLPGPGMANYSATKAFVLSLTEAIREEVSGTGVQVTALCPGFTKTGFQARAGVHAAGQEGIMWQDARTVAAAGWAGFRRGDDVVVPGIVNKVSAASVRFAPRSLVRKISASTLHKLL